MIKKQADIILNLILIIGFIIYSILCLANNIATAIIWLIFILYFWIFWSMYYNRFSLQKLLKICCYTGIIFSITYFLMYALEEIPYPEGAILFHEKHIATSMLIFFVSSLPLIYKYSFNHERKSLETLNIQKDQKSAEVSEEWEAASIQDLESGEFEPI